MKESKNIQSICSCPKSPVKPIKDLIAIIIREVATAFFIGNLAKSTKAGIIKKGGEVIGHWPTESYEFVKSKALMNDKTFYGLALDEGNQYDLSAERIDKWLVSLGLDIS